MSQFDYDLGCSEYLPDNHPRRYVVAPSGERVLIGLSVQETREFELAADAASLANERRARKRWFTLYSKHERSWRRRISSTLPQANRR